ARGEIRFRAGEVPAGVLDRLRGLPPRGAVARHPAAWVEAAEEGWILHEAGSARPLAPARPLALAGEPSRDPFVLVPTRGRDRRPLVAAEIERALEVARLAGEALEGGRLPHAAETLRAAADAAANRGTAVARLAQRLAQSPDLESTVEAIGGAIVPWLADWVL